MHRRRAGRRQPGAIGHPRHQRQLLAESAGGHVDRGAGHARAALGRGGHVQEPGGRHPGRRRTGVAVGAQQLAGRMPRRDSRGVEGSRRHSSAINAEAGQRQRRADQDGQHASGGPGSIGGPAQPMVGEPGVGQQAEPGDQQVHAQRDHHRQQRPIHPDHGQAAQHDPGRCRPAGRATGPPATGCSAAAARWAWTAVRSTIVRHHQPGAAAARPPRSPGASSPVATSRPSPRPP